MNFPLAHTERIQELGYTESEARFLYIVAVFSGYFTLRQFRVFTGSSYGKRPTSFAQKLITQGHAKARRFVRRGAIFHLFSRSAYSQKDKENLRNRKRHSFDFMRSRLVLLDFILANQHLNYFETEQDKISFFCSELGISQDCLPAKVYEGAVPNRQTIRYFVDKFPVFVAPPFSGALPVVTFTYVDLGSKGRPTLPRICLPINRCFSNSIPSAFCISRQRNPIFCGAEERFRSLVKRPLESDISNGILRYFQIRKKWDNHEYIIPVTADLEFLRDSPERFQGERIESLYRSLAVGRPS